MTATLLRRGLAGLALLALLSACAPKPWDDPIEISRLVRLEPKDFRVRTLVPAGLGETGTAYFQWAIATHTSEEPEIESMELVRTGEPVPAEGGMTEVTYRLEPKDYKTFQTQQIRQRAQLLADYYYIAVLFVPGLCNMVGTEAGRDQVVSVMFDGRTGDKITTTNVGLTASEIKTEVGFCV
ncbi:hypothetical protein [Mangrovicoccus ximenensis]|uniref:hypothetical protein n=1 Tax=Mangrovicoccus ximenensis TaxID=1911570 RepID=UPI000D396A48|nr:hypothetical protein [Mangrovicoccus ximenensis]